MRKPRLVPVEARNDVLVQKITKLLTEIGPMTRAELCDHNEISSDKRNVSTALSRMNKASPRRPKRVYVLNYVFDHEGEKQYPSAVYAAGDLPDAKKPKPKPLEVKKRYRERIKGRTLANSVFNLGLSRTKLRALHQSIRASTLSQ